MIDTCDLMREAFQQLAINLRSVMALHLRQASSLHGQHGRL